MPSLEHFTDTGRAVLVEVDDDDLSGALRFIDRTGLGKVPVVARVLSVPRETSEPLAHLAIEEDGTVRQMTRDPHPGDNPIRIVPDPPPKKGPRP